MEMGLASCLFVGKERDQTQYNYYCGASWPVFLVSRLVTFLYGKPPPTDPTDKIELQWSKHKISPNNHPARQLYFISTINSLPNISSLLLLSRYSCPPTFLLGQIGEMLSPNPIITGGRRRYQEFINLSWYPEIVLPVRASSPGRLYPFSRLSLGSIRVRSCLINGPSLIIISYQHNTLHCSHYSHPLASDSIIHHLPQLNNPISPSLSQSLTHKITNIWNHKESSFYISVIILWSSIMILTRYCPTLQSK